MKTRIARLLAALLALGACREPTTPTALHSGSGPTLATTILADGITDLGTLGGSSATAFGINGAGSVVGSSETASGQTHAFLWNPNTQTMQDIGTLGGSFSEALAIDEMGRVVGVSTRSDNVPRPFIWDGQLGMREIPGELPGRRSGKAYALSGNLVVGEMNADADGGDDLRRRAFAYDLATGVLRDLGSLNHVYSKATGVNGAGRIVGFSSTGCCYVPVTWDGPTGEITALQMGPGANYGLTAAINAAGLIVGSTATSGLWAMTTWTSATAQSSVPAPVGVGGFGESVALAVSDAGYIAGRMYRTGDTVHHAMLWDPTTQAMTDLGASLPTRQSVALGINSAANGRVTVVGYVRMPDRKHRAVIFHGHQPADITPPSIQSTLTGPLGNNGWYTGDVRVAWTVTDLESAISATTGCDDVVVTNDELNATFNCSATSAGGNASRAVSISRDATGPIIAYGGNAGAYTVDQTVSISCTTSDALSGIASSTCASVSGPAYTFALGSNQLTSTSTDNAGNTTHGATSFTISVTNASLCVLVERWVSKSGVAHSLCVKVNAGNYDAFRNELAAQRGKAISDENAAILLTLAGGL